MVWSLAELGEKELIYLPLLLAATGLVLLLFWPLDSEYRRIAPSALMLMQDGQWVEMAGALNEVRPKPAGYSLQICDAPGQCATVSVPDRAAREYRADGRAPAKGTRLHVRGEVGLVQNRPFVRAHHLYDE